MLAILLEGEEKAAMIKKKEISHIGLWLDDGRHISALQRKKIYASIRDFSIFTGYTSMCRTASAQNQCSAADIPRLSDISGECRPDCEA